MPRNPVIAAWVAGGMIWGAALLGLGVMDGPMPLTELPQSTQHSSWTDTEEVSDAYERALDGDAWGEADLPHQGGFLPVGAPDS